MSLQTEFPFTLPRGYVDESGTLHREGVMRLATARDEIEPLRDARVKENEAYLTVIVLSRTMVKLGSVPQVTPRTIEGLFSSDLAYLQDFYTRINFGGAAEQAAVLEEVQAGAAYEVVPVPFGSGGRRRLMTYPAEDTWDEVSYLAYHLHWDIERLVDLEHDDRLMLVAKVADLNRRAWEGVKQLA